MYINFMLEENKNNNILRWLMLITLLVTIMIIIGGLTRLTDSGLSITKWDLFFGIIPPLTFEKWERAFSLYLVDRVIPMLPEKISNKICSLNERKDSLCFSLSAVKFSRFVIFENDYTTFMFFFWSKSVK